MIFQTNIAIYIAIIVYKLNDRPVFCSVHSNKIIFFTNLAHIYSDILSVVHFALLSNIQIQL